MTTSTLTRPAHDSLARPAAQAPPRARWERPALLSLLGATAVLYLWALGESGWANAFYSAAVQAGSESWKAFFFGSSDAANSITVDKTPLALWPMALSVRIFGLSSWSILVPQALFGVASVGLLHATVRRTTGSAAAGLLAGAILALTPVATLMFRFNNPDALLTLLLIGSAAATLRAVDATSTGGRALRWLMLAGALVGLAFLAKMLQAFLVLPALVAAYALFAKLDWRHRVGHLLAAFAAMLVAGGWWVAIVELWPASSRPYIGGSQNNSILELALGYNGLGRLTGDETGSVGGGMGWGQTGLLRLLDTQNGGQIGWLIPAALVLGPGALWWARRDNHLRAGLTVWLGWLLVTGLTFSLMAGIFHPYYSVALAPAVAACVAIGASVLWRARSSVAASALLAVATLAAAVTGFVLLNRSADFLPWLRYAVLALGFVGAGLLAVRTLVPGTLARGAAVIAVTAALAGPAAYSVQTVTTAHTGSIPSAGPSVAGGFGPGGFPGQGPGGAAGGLLDASRPSAELTALLSEDAESYTWVAAAVGSQSASGFQLATEEPVLPIGGFNGSDPSPTLAQFQAWVDAGEIHYFIAGGQGGGPGAGQGGSGGGGSAQQIAAWVADNFDAQTVDGVTVYPLATGTQSGGAA